MKPLVSSRSLSGMSQLSSQTVFASGFASHVRNETITVAIFKKLNLDLRSGTGS
jgi:hypothetical protein